MTVYFKGDVLELVDSDVLPSESEFAQRLAGPKANVKVPVLEATEEVLKKFESPQPASDAVRPAAVLPSQYPPLEPALR